ncbi:MAG TPA: hypothetical protein VGP22_11380, partial [Albitalea sp.]|nr:hypothetical protein [Albitalea sp.]
PLFPLGALVAFTLWSVTAWRWPGLWLVALPASLPAMSFAPWTGWIVVDEFDLVVLGTCAGGFMRRAADSLPDSAGAPRLPRVLPWLCVGVSALALARGFASAGMPVPGWFDAESSALNGARVFKGVLYAALLTPLLRDELGRRSPDLVFRRFALGMGVGAAVVVGAALWERAAYPGLLDFSSSYRTVALFWEMHVGGAAIDAYLVIAMPFLLWAVCTADTVPRWIAAALLAVLAEYACLTTFSRGVYGAAAVGLLMAAVMRRQQAPPAPPRWRRPAQIALIAVLAAEALLVLGSSTFMAGRVAGAANDFGSRLTHWSHGLRLLDSVGDWSLGKGVGRFPADYAATVPGRDFPGAARVASAPARKHLELFGPVRSDAIAAYFALTQRLPLRAVGAYRVNFDARVTAGTELRLAVCARHLLYDRGCQEAIVHLEPQGGRWQPAAATLQGPPLDAGSLWPSRSGVFSIGLMHAGSAAAIDNVVLTGDGAANLLLNGDFAHDLAGWFPSAQQYFVPWHIDNLYLETLIEQGIIGVAAYGLLIGSALAGLLSTRGRRLPAAPFLAGSLVGTLVLGLVSSLFDVPRVAALFLFVACLSLHLTALTARKP